MVLQFNYTAVLISRMKPKLGVDKAVPNWFYSWPEASSMVPDWLFQRRWRHVFSLGIADEIFDWKATYREETNSCHTEVSSLNVV